MTPWVFDVSSYYLGAMLGLVVGVIAGRATAAIPAWLSKPINLSEDVAAGRRRAS